MSTNLDIGTYGPNQQRARAFLTRLQAQTYQSLGMLPPPKPDMVFFEQVAAELIASQYPQDSAEQKNQRIRATLEQMPELKQSLPYEDPVLLGVMRRLATEIEAACTAQEWPLESRPLLGTLPGGQVNALTYSVPGTQEHLVLFEPKLFTFALLLSKAIAQSFPSNASNPSSFSTLESDIEEWIKRDGRASNRFREVVLAYAVEGHPAQAPPYYPESVYGRLADLIRQSMELFIMGHEYAHVLLGHLAGPEATFANDADAILYSWQQELMADKMGFVLSARAMQDANNADLSFALVGADFFFSASDIMDRTVSILATGELSVVQLGSHPPAALRQSRLREAMDEIVGETVAAGPKKLAGAFDHAVTLLWAETEPVVRAIHSRGIRPAPMWLQRLEPTTNDT